MTGALICTVQAEGTWGTLCVTDGPVSGLIHLPRLSRSWFWNRKYVITFHEKSADLLPHDSHLQQLAKI